MAEEDGLAQVTAEGMASLPPPPWLRVVAVPCHIKAQSEATCMSQESKDTSNKEGPSRKIG